MLVLDVRNVNHALPLAMMYFQQGGTHIMKTSPRGLDTLEWDTPVTTVYNRPLECVLFDVTRDANPFFHLFEAMWILAGRDDVKFLAELLPRMRDFSDNGHSFHAAYGFRLRQNLGDQLKIVAQMLNSDPDTRRAVVSIWDTVLDLATDSKDIPCNDTIAFRRRYGNLDMTVFNRSNDVIWGAYGANAVQFSFIHQWVAAAAGIPVGRYFQVSNSFHVYTNEQYERLKGLGLILDDPYSPQPGNGPLVRALPFGDPFTLDNDLHQWFGRWDDGDNPAMGSYMSDWVAETLTPAWLAFQQYRERKWSQALDTVTFIKAPDWRLAMRQWLERRAVK